MAEVQGLADRPLNSVTEYAKMALLEYATRTVPDVVKKSVPAFFNKDPLFLRLQKSNRVKRSGGTHVRIVRIKDGHSDVVQLDGSNMSIPLNKKETLSSMTGDWAKYAKPLIIPHIDRDRMSSKDEQKQYVEDMTTAALQSLQNDVIRQIYIGNVSKLDGLGTLNGNKTALTTSGFTNGALKFQTPANQAAGATSYLNETRVVDTTDFVDNWYNQFGQMSTGIGTDFLPTAEEVKLTADSFSPSAAGISLGVLSITDMVGVSDEVRAYPGGGASALQYSVADLEAGKAHPTVYMVNGVQYYPNRWMTAANIGSTEPAYLLNPDTIEWWVNAGNDFRVTKFVDFLETSGQDADVAFIILECQFAVTNLMANGCVSQ